jgi:hypothetical protein
MTLVAEPDAEPDETLAAHGAETERVVVDYPSTGVQAWSAAEDYFEDLDDGSWGAALSRAAVPLFIAAVVAFGVAVAGWLTIDNRREQTPVQQTVGAPITVPVTPDTPTAVAPPVMPPDVTNELTGDQWYLNMVNAGLAPIDMSVSNPAGEVSDGHRVCGYIAQGHTLEQTIDEIIVGLPDTLTPQKAHTIAQVVAAAAVRAYCPEPRP